MTQFLCPPEMLPAAPKLLDGLLRAATRFSILATDLDGVIRVFNAGSERLLGYRAAELVGCATPARLHLPREVGERSRELTRELGRPVEGFEAFVALVRQGGPGATDCREWTYVRKDGGHVPVELTVTGIRSEAGELEGFLAMAQDLSLHKALEADLRRAQVSFDNAGDTILWARESDARITFVNRAASELLGYTQAELLERTVLDINPLRDLAGWREHCRRVRNRGRVTVEMEFLRKDGGRVPVEINATLAEHDGVMHCVGIVRDTSPRKALEASLRQAQVCLDSASDIVLWTDIEQRRIAYANNAACQVLGYTREELLGLEVSRVNPTRTDANWLEVCRQLREQGQCVFETAYVRKDGTRIPVETSARIIEHEGREYAVGVGRDVSPRKALEASLRQAQVCLDNTLDMVLWVGLEDRRIAYANQASLQLLGYSPEELAGQDVSLVNPGRTPEKWEAACRQLRRDGRNMIVAEYRRKDGSLVPVELNARLVEHEGREYSVVVVRDIGLRKAAEARLLAETGLNRSLAEAARALLAPEPDVRAIASILLDRACELTGSRHGYVAFIDQISGDMQPRAMSAMMKSGECALGALPVTFPPGPDGVYPGLWGHSLNTREGFFSNDPAGHPSAKGLPQGHVPVRRLLTMPALAQGRLVGQIALANAGRDYTSEDLGVVQALADLFALGAEQILNQRRIKEAMDQARRSDRAKSDFLANMTHEVRTPLNGILGMLQVLLGTSLDGEQREYADVALESAERLHRLLGSILDYARLDSAPDPELRAFPPTDLLHGLEAVFAPLARAKGLRLEVEAEPGLPGLVRGDPEALRQALAELLHNAVKFTAEGQVRLTAGPAPQEPGVVRFRVEDTGIGIPAEKRAEVFEAFVQADPSSTRVHGGAGLGLAIARRQAQRLGGRVEACERPGGGTVMLLTVPAPSQALE